MTWHAEGQFATLNGQPHRRAARLVCGDTAGPLLGAVVLTNPGSARPSGAVDSAGWAPMTLDPTLRIVIEIAEAAYQQAGVAVPTGGWLAVWNLFTLCEPDLKTALNNVIALPALPELPPGLPWVWCGWGQAHPALRELIAAWQLHLAGQPVAGVPIVGTEGGYYHPRYLRRMRRLRPDLWLAAVTGLANLIHN